MCWKALCLTLAKALVFCPEGGRAGSPVEGREPCAFWEGSTRSLLKAKNGIASTTVPTGKVPAPVSLQNDKRSLSLCSRITVGTRGSMESYSGLRNGCQFPWHTHRETWDTRAEVAAWLSRTQEAARPSLCRCPSPRLSVWAALPLPRLRHGTWGSSLLPLQWLVFLSPLVNWRKGSLSKPSLGKGLTHPPCGAIGQWPQALKGTNEQRLHPQVSTGPLLLPVSDLCSLWLAYRGIGSGFTSGSKLKGSYLSFLSCPAELLSGISSLKKL